MPSERPDKVTLAVIEARDNVRLIQEWSMGHDLDALRADRKTRYAIERAFIAMDSAIRDIPADVLAFHGIPAKMIAGTRNALAHTYDDILDERVMLTIRDDLPALDAALARILAENRAAADIASPFPRSCLLTFVWLAPKERVLSTIPADPPPHLPSLQNYHLLRRANHWL